ncbi:hypothetical protein AXF42_Ash004878 [Apostasia shenzhenica]|uniref:Uncharacterized protein n=1 Tax=Apostasia shenzhenica TaxID=1088818 RepID=A0A2I0B7T9_9ASPA|nr:hypothetical protein AXF42_Ash004878 [Apostasia shenzhenica]
MRRSSRLRSTAPASPGLLHDARSPSPNSTGSRRPRRASPRLLRILRATDTPTPFYKVLSGDYDLKPSSVPVHLGPQFSSLDRSLERSRGRQTT